MQDMFAALITFFLVEPVQHEIADALAASRAPHEVMASVVTCAAEHGPQIVDRALGDPWWAASSVFGVWIGLAEPVALLAEAAQPFLEKQ